MIQSGEQTCCPMDGDLWQCSVCSRGPHEVNDDCQNGHHERIASSPIGSVAEARRVVLDHFYALGAYPDLEVDALIEAVRNEKSA